MLVGQPVVLGVLVLKVRIPLPALLLSEILKVLGAILSVAELELIARPYTCAASIGWTAEDRKQWLVWSLTHELNVYQTLCDTISLPAMSIGT